jgi:hypothetical protein
MMGWTPEPRSPQMTTTHTKAGTPIVEMSPDEYAAYLDREARKSVGMSVAEFRAAYSAGTVDDADPAVGDLVGLLRIGQNGQHAVA